MIEPWKQFMYTADAWLVSYLARPRFLHLFDSFSVEHFTLGHAAELYLKGAYTKMTGDMKTAVKFGHDLHSLWDACKSVNSGFMPEYNFVGNEYERVVTTSTCLTLDEEIHLASHGQWYMVARCLVDWKYPHVAAKGQLLPNNFAVASDDYWIRLFWELRKFLGFPEPGDTDTPREAWESNEQLLKGESPGPQYALDPTSKHFLGTMLHGPEPFGEDFAGRLRSNIIAGRLARGVTEDLPTG